MAKYAAVEDVESRYGALSDSEKQRVEVLLDDAGVMIDTVASRASDGVKKIVSCRMVERAIGSGSDAGTPIGATQGSASALGYSQSWTIGSGASGELYLSKQDRSMLGVGDRVGAHSPLEDTND